MRVFAFLLKDVILSFGDSMKMYVQFIAIFVLSIACTGDSSEGFGVPVGEVDDSDLNQPDSGDVESEDGRQVGDVLSTIATYPDPPTGQIIDEWVDVAIYDQS